MAHFNVDHIRNVLRYVDRFQNAVAVLYIDERVIASPLFTGLISDIRLMRQAGIRVIIVPGARKRIDEILLASGIPWTMKGGWRITGDDAMPLIKMAAFDVSNIVMTALAGERLDAVIGNWVRARRRGVINGVDYGGAGEIDSVNTDSLRAVLESGIVPIFPCIGWSASGKPYNISSLALAVEIASRFLADKLFLVAPEARLPVPDLTLEEARTFVERGRLAGEPPEEILGYLSSAVSACERGVARTHILDGSEDGALLCEVFSEFGSGTMVYKNTYGGIRDMTVDDVPAVVTLMRPFIEKGMLLPRTQADIASEYQDYIVFELDGGIRACSALRFYGGGQAEIAAVAVNEAYSRLGAGPKMIQFLVERARKRGASSVFVLTTQAADWFEQQGFKSDTLESLPQKRKDAYIPGRGSKIFRLNLS
jgi:amino-acid N-acetyltransferase